MPHDTFTKMVLSVLSGLLIVAIGASIQVYTEMKVVSSRLETIETYMRERFSNLENRMNDHDQRLRSIEKLTQNNQKRTRQNG